MKLCIKIIFNKRVISLKITVNIKKVGKRKNSIEALLFEIEKKPYNVNELIVEIVKICVKKYNERKENNEILQNLTLQQIDDMTETGKVSFGVNYGENAADVEKAIDNALLSFKDGIYRVFLNNNELMSLDEEISLDESSNVTFVRMTMLAGRMW